jgi:predicted ATPase/class 3 adenylate cyclase
MLKGVGPLPTGTVTFLFTDIEGSTRRLRDLGDAYADASAEHRRVLRDAFARHGGVEVDAQGDSFFVAFARAIDAVAAAREGQHALAPGPIRVRMGLHTGEPFVTDEGYVGIDVHRAARIAAAGHGGQVLASQSTRDLVRADRFRDLGEHRLKDLTAPERIYQLGDATFPPLRSLNQTNLPVEATPLIGRERELGELIPLVSEHRLVTITGPGGAGKTRLALQVAAEAVEEFEDGVWWVPLATLRDPDLVLPTVVQTLGAKNGLAEHLRNRRTLLLLDNFEQVVAAAPALFDVLAFARDVRLLVTSREPLHLSGEHEYPVPPLPEAEAVVLFIQRARAIMPTFEPDRAVAEICRRVDGLPLAVELAAARVKMLSSRAILERLERRLSLLTGGPREMPERQRTLRATVEWSYELLDDVEKRLFARIAVFAGGYMLEAAEAVCEADLDTLQSLIDKSLILRSGERFWMLETIREHALERLEESGNADELRRRHAHHFLAFAEKHDEDDSREEQVTLFTGEHDNLRAALAWLDSQAELDLELRLACSLWFFWFVRGYHAEGRWWLERGLRANPPVRLRARALHGLAALMLMQIQLERAEDLEVESLALWRELGDIRGTAESLNLLAAIVVERDPERARACFGEALDLARGVDDQRLIATVAGNLGTFAYTQGDHAGAEAALTESLTIRLERGDRIGVAHCYENLGFSALAERRYERAAGFLRQALRLFWECGVETGMVGCFEGLPSCLAAAGKSERGAVLLGAARALRRRLEYEMSSSERDTYERGLAAARGAIAEEELSTFLAEGEAMELEEAVEFALAT